MKKSFRNFFSSLRERRLTMRMKFILSMSSIAVILLLSSVISVLEYKRMSNYVSDLIASNIKCLNISARLADITDNYNLEVLSVIGDETSNALPAFDRELFYLQCDTLKQSMTSRKTLAVADSVSLAYTDYMLTSYELENVISSAFIDSREWYFSRLQPSFNRLHAWLDILNESIYSSLRANSETFQASFYRSIVPGVVSVAAGLLLVLLLLFFFLSYFVDPVSKMSGGVSVYRSTGKKYTCTFDGDDDLSALNEAIAEITEENVELKRRLKIFKAKIEAHRNGSSEESSPQEPLKN